MNVKGRVFLSCFFGSCIRLCQNIRTQILQHCYKGIDICRGSDFLIFHLIILQYGQFLIDLGNGIGILRIQPGNGSVHTCRIGNRCSGVAVVGKQDVDGIHTGIDLVFQPNDGTGNALGIGHRTAGVAVFSQHCIQFAQAGSVLTVCPVDGTLQACRIGNLCAGVAVFSQQLVDLAHIVSIVLFQTLLQVRDIFRRADACVTDSFRIPVIVGAVDLFIDQCKAIGISGLQISDQFIKLFRGIHALADTVFIQNITEGCQRIIHSGEYSCIDTGDSFCQVLADHRLYILQACADSAQICIIALQGSFQLVCVDRQQCKVGKLHIIVQHLGKLQSALGILLLLQAHCCQIRCRSTFTQIYENALLVDRKVARSVILQQRQVKAILCQRCDQIGSSLSAQAVQLHNHSLQNQLCIGVNTANQIQDLCLGLIVNTLKHADIAEIFHNIQVFVQRCTGIEHSLDNILFLC